MTEDRVESEAPEGVQSGILVFNIMSP
jgi:hypothetical protein